MRNYYCLLLAVCALLANNHLLAQALPCAVTISTDKGTTLLNCKEDYKEITLTANPTGADTYKYAWELNGTPLSSDSALKVQLPGLYTVKVTGFSQDVLQCTTSSSIVIKKDDALPNFTILSNPNPICRGQVTTLYALGVGDFQWDFGSHENSVSVSLLETTTFKLTGTGANGCSDTKSFTVIVNQPPAALIEGIDKVCQNEPQPLVTFAGEGGKQPYTFAFNINDGPTQTISTKEENKSVSLGVPTTALGPVKYQLLSIADDNHCSQPQSGSVTTQILQATTFTSPRKASVCNNARFTYTATSSNGTTAFHWTRLVSDSITSNQPASGYTPTITDTLINNLSSPHVVKYAFVLSSGSSCTVNDTLEVTVNPTVVINPVTSDTFCNGIGVKRIAFSSPNAGARFRWSCDKPIGFGLSGSDSIPAFTATNLSDTSVKATITVFALTADSSCRSESTSFAITVLPAPVLISRKDKSVCDSTTFTYIAESSAPGTKYLWRIIPVDGVTSNSPASGTTDTITDLLDNATFRPVIVKYGFELFANTGCSITKDTLRVTVNPSARIGALVNDTLCNGFKANGITFPSPTAGAHFRWTCDTSIGFGLSGKDSIPRFTASNLENKRVTATIWVYAFTGDSCNGDAKSFTITVRPAPLVRERKNMIVCNNTAFTDTVKSSLPGTMFRWKRIPAKGVSGLVQDSGTTAFISDQLFDSTQSPVVVQYSVELFADSGCGITRDTLEVTVYPTPQISAIPAVTYCNGTQVKGIPFSSPSDGKFKPSYQWRIDSIENTPRVSIGFGLNGKDSIPAFTATNLGSTSVMSKVKVFALTNNGCTGDSTDFTITVNRSPVKPAFTSLFNQRGNNANTLSLCSGAVNINFNVTVLDSGASYRWTSTSNNSGKSVIRNDSNYNTVISFLNEGNYTVKLTDSVRETNGCINVDSQTVIVGARPVISDLRNIQVMQPGNLLVYPDNTMNSYQWGYDTAINDVMGVYGRPVPVQGQINQFFIPEPRFIDAATKTLDTVKYKYWVLLQTNTGCYTRVYYNGRYSTNRVITNPPVADTAFRLQIIPNPNPGVFRISLKGNMYGTITAQIRNTVGQTLFTKTFTKMLPAVTEQFSTGNLPPGVYFLTLYGRDLKTVVSPLVIQR